jgi:hypothetical protein
LSISIRDMKDRKPACYQIKIEGAIREDWSDWMNGMEIAPGKGCADSQTTTLTGIVTDQAALRGILCLLWDLNHTIISVVRLVSEPGEKGGKNE